MDALYWRLYYADDSYVDEPLGNLSIRSARAGAVQLVACFPTEPRQPLVRIALLGDQWRPVWYRKRSMGITNGQSGPRLDITVFGRAKEGKHAVDCQLWACMDGRTVINCPKWAIDQRAIEGLIGIK